MLQIIRGFTQPGDGKEIELTLARRHKAQRLSRGLFSPWP